MQNTTRPAKLPTGYDVRARARRIEAERVVESASFLAAGRCTCGLPATRGPRCKVCHDEHAQVVKAAFGGLS